MDTLRMRRITSRLLVGLCTGGALLAGSQLFAQRLTSYEVKVETQPGVVVVTFSVESGQARVYLPDDLEAQASRSTAKHNLSLTDDTNQLYGKAASKRF